MSSRMIRLYLSTVILIPDIKEVKVSSMKDEGW